MVFCYIYIVVVYETFAEIVFINIDAMLFIR